MLESNWLHVSKVIIRKIDNDCLLSLGFRDRESYSSLRVVLQFGWSEIVQPMSSYASSSSGIDLPNKKQAIQFWKNRQKVQDSTL